MRARIESKREIAKKARAYEDWAVKCFLKTLELRISGDFDDTLHLEVEADYWFGMAEKTRKAERWRSFLTERKNRISKKTKGLPK